ncbi:MAG: hypothetical protein ABI345_01985 [Jatrophihabitans sp.]
MSARKALAALVVGTTVLTAACSSDSKKPDNSASTVQLSAPPASAVLALPQIMTTNEAACRFESLLGAQYVIEGKGNSDVVATLGSTLGLASPDGARGVYETAHDALLADATAAKSGLASDGLLRAVVVAIKTGCTARANPIVTKAQWAELAQLVGAEQASFDRVRVFREAGRPG